MVSLLNYKEKINNWCLFEINLSTVFLRIALWMNLNEVFIVKGELIIKTPKAFYKSYNKLKVTK